MPRQYGKVSRVKPIPTQVAGSIARRLVYFTHNLRALTVYCYTKFARMSEHALKKLPARDDIESLFLLPRDAL